MVPLNSCEAKTIWDAIAYPDGRHVSTCQAQSQALSGDIATLAPKSEVFQFWEISQSCHPSCVYCTLTHIQLGQLRKSLGSIQEKGVGASYW